MIFDWFRAKAGFPQLDFTSDCHCHLLPGVDDGSGSLEESVTILSEMMALGIKSLVLTPHINPEIFPSNKESFIMERYEEFTAALPPDIRSSVKMSLGAEYMVVSGFEKRRFSKLLHFIPGKVLIEMSYLYVSPNIEQTLFEMSMSSVVPVIAHPERYIYLAGSLDTFERYHDMGAEFQMNLLSLSGAYGPASLRILNYLHKKGWYSYYGTDVHNLNTIRNISRMRFDRSLL